jgi:DNA-3-methyladenine glycosylase II
VVPLSLMTFTMVPTPPFRLDLTVWTLRRRAANAIDRWDGRVYRRVLALRGTAVEIAVVQVGSRIRVEAQADGRLPRDARARVVAMLERVLGLRTDLAPFYRFAQRDARLRPLADRFRGFKPPRFPSVFEALLNAFACQQLSITVGLELLNRLSERYGAGSADGRPHGFPEAAAMAPARIGSLRRLGFSRAKSRGMIELARAVADGRLDLDGLAELDDDDARTALLALRGVGRWSAEYVLLRGLGRLHVFPGDDVGARKALGQWLGSRTLSGYDAVERALSPWKRWAGLIYFHLLLRGLADRDQLA